MGTFAGLFSGNNAKIPDNKKEEFAERVEKLFQIGGMMEIERIQICGNVVTTIRKAKMHGSKMDFYYNYFEDDFWENAGVDEYGVWSEKIGWSHFHTAVVAAYVLEELYTEGVAVAMVDGEPVTSWGYVGWINYLFQEKYHVKNFDPWKLYETLHDLKTEFYGGIPCFGDKRYAFIGNCEIYAIENGVNKAIEVFEKKEKENLENVSFKGMSIATDIVKNCINVNEFDKENQLEVLINTIRVFYEKEDEVKNVSDVYSEDCKWLLESLKISDAPALIVKTISELFDKDFWELWAGVRDIVKRKQTKLYGNDEYYVMPISTTKFFRQSPDDMILYWEENGDLEFSQDLWKWFEVIKYKYDNIVRSDFSIENPLEYIIGLMEEADDNYYRIYTVAEFFEETLENLCDKRYQSIWKLYEEILREPELKEAGDVIFVPDGPEYENVGVHYLGKQPKRRLMKIWNMTDLNKRNNKARVTYRRYMALVANKELRWKVLGF